MSTRWSRVALGKALRVRYGKAHPKEDRSEGAPFPVVGSAGVMGFTHTPLTKEPTVVIGRKGNVGQSHYIESGCWPTDTTYFVLMPDGVNPRFLTYQLEHLNLRRLDQSTTTPSLRREDLEAQLVVLPSSSEQRRIVDILEEHLTSLDAAKANASAAATKTEALRLAALRSVRRTAEGSGNSRPLGHVATTTLGKMLDAKRQTGTPTSYLRNINVRWGSFDLSDLQSTLLTADDVDRLTLQPGDLLVCEGGEPGRCAIWREPAPGIAFQKALHRVRVNDTNELRPAFAALVIEEGIRTGRWERYFTGTTIKHLPQQKLRMLDIPLPPGDVQDALVRAAAGLESGRQRLRSQLDVLRIRGDVLRRALLSAAFSGQLTGRSSDTDIIEDLADEEAS